MGTACLVRKHSRLEFHECWLRMESILLTGGPSSRMGRDKASLLVNGRCMADRILDELLAATDRVTVCGRCPLPGADFLPDEDEFQGPLAALAQYRPMGFRVFVASCDLVWFDRSVVAQLSAALGPHEAAIPTIVGCLQPLCAVYRRSAFDFARQVESVGENRLIRWIEGLDYVAVPAETLSNPRAVIGFHTPDEFESVLVRPAG